MPVISEHLAPAALVIVRLGGLMVFGPVVGSPMIPVRVRVLLALLLGLAMYPVVAGHWPVEQRPALELWSLAPLLAGEAMLGLAIGYLASLPLLAAETGGLLMGQQMGLGFATFFNPAIDTEGDLLGQILFFLAVTAFLALGGHETMLLAVMHSFTRVPPGGLLADSGLVELACAMLISSLELALRVAAPVLALVFLETIALGFLSKTVPQLNILSLGFPLRIMLGLAAAVTCLGAMHGVLVDGMRDGLELLLHWIDAMGGPGHGG